MTYRETKALNQSYLKDLIKGPPFTEKKETEDMKLGTLTDWFITQSNNFIKENVYIPVAEVPTKGPKAVIDLLVERDYPFTDSAIISVANELNYGNGRYKDDRILREIKEKNEDYIEELDKIKSYELVVSKEMYEEAKRLADMCVNHHYTAMFFKAPHVFQHAQYWKHGEYDCKGLYDMLIREDGTKFIPQALNDTIIVDIKVSTLPIKTAIRRFRYDIQGSWYRHGMGKADFALIFLKPGCSYPRWTILSESDLAVGRYGGNYINGLWTAGTGHLNDDQYGWEQALQLHEIYKSNPNVDWESQTKNGYNDIKAW